MADMSFGAGQLKGFGLSMPHIANGTIVLIAEVVLIIALLCGMLFFFLYYKKFSTRVIIISQREGMSRKVFMDKGAFLRKKRGHEEFRLFRERKSIKPPEYKYLIPAQKGNVLFLYQSGTKEYYPMLPEENIKTMADPTLTNRVNFIGEDQEVANWATMQMMENRLVFKSDSLLMQVLPIMAIVLTGVFILLLLYALLNKFDIISDAAASLDNAATALASFGKQTVPQG